MRINTTKAILLLLCLYAITKANGQAGTFDSSFGLNGLVETDFTNIQSESALRVLRQQDGKLVVLFNARGASWLSRYFNNGTKDLNFTDYTEEQYNNGFIQLQAGTAFQASDLALQKNGNLLVAGNVKGDQLDFSLVQHLPSGFTDNGFGNNGQVITSITPGQNDNATAMAIQQDGKIVVVGCTNTGSQRDFAIVRYNTDGSLDNTFSGDGKLTTDFNSGNDTALAVILQPDGKILVGGVSTANSSQKKSFALARYNSNGTLDLTFSGDGKLTTDISMGDDVLKSLSLQSDGKILAGGYTTTGQTDFALVRYLSDGTLDNTFDGDGKLTTDIAQRSSDTLQSIAVQGDGKILAGGFTRSARGYDFALVRYLSGGVMDPAFATGGKNIADQGTPLDIANQMVLLQDGKILMAGQRGSDQTDLVVTRFTTTGLPDPTMLGNGRIVDHLKGSSIYYAMAIQRDGRIVAGGATSDVNTHGTHHDYALARYLINGQLDPSFGNGGMVTQHFNNNYFSYITEVAIQNDGKIVVAGTVPLSGTNASDFELSRYKTNGSLDSSFGVYGVLFIDFGNSADEANGLAIQPDGKIVVSGSARGGGQKAGLAVARLLPDGTLDNSFGSGGKEIVEAGETDYTGTGAEGYDLALQPDGKIVMGGRAQVEGRRVFLAVRVNSNGTLDNTFNGNGINIMEFNDYWASVVTMQLQPDQKIILVGYPNFTVVRLNPYGTLDPTFNGDGFARYTFNLNDEQSFASALQPDGKILAGGSANLAFALARYNTDGSLDNTFAGGGMQRYDITPDIDHFYVLKIYGNRLFGVGMTHKKYDDFIGYQGSIATLASLKLDLGVFTFYRDVDQDGYGNSAKSVKAEKQPWGYVLQGGDCNDNNATVYPGAPELCDGLDNNCNGAVDEGLARNTFYRDYDGDGYGEAKLTTKACSAPPGYASKSGDCQNADKTIYPGAPELCDGVDNNCNGQVDEGCPMVVPTMMQKSLSNSGDLFATVYPNPSSQAFTLVIQSNNSKEVKLKVTDIAGRLIEQRDGIQVNSLQSIGSGYQPGIYMAEIMQGNKSVNIRLLKQK